MRISREIIKKILSNVGVMFGSNSNKFGLTLPEFKVDKNFIVHYEDGQETIHSIWSGEVCITQSKIKALLVDLSTPQINCPEFALAFRADQKPIYVVKMIYDDMDDGDFLIQEHDTWVSPNLSVKLLALIGMEAIVDQGMQWIPCAIHDDLYYAISQIIEM